VPGGSLKDFDLDLDLDLHFALDLNFDLSFVQYLDQSNFLGGN
jgi:hypothetical protein